MKIQLDITKMVKLFLIFFPLFFGWILAVISALVYRSYYAYGMGIGYIIGGWFITMIFIQAWGKRI